MADACLHAPVLPVRLHIVEAAMLPSMQSRHKAILKWCCLRCSRNNMLSGEERAKATCIHQALKWAQNAAASGEASTATKLCDGVRQRVADGGGRVDYVEASIIVQNTCYIQGPGFLQQKAVNQCRLPLAASMQNYVQYSHITMCLSTWQAVDAEELQLLDTLAGGRVLVAVAALFGSVRLIDNVVLEPT